MVTRKSTDSSDSALGPLDRRLPLNDNTDTNATDCPPTWPTCGPEPKVSNPVPALVEPASSASS